MKAQCLPFRIIPHTTKLFLDFISDYSKLQDFYPRPPQFEAWLQEESGRVNYDPARRERVTTALERQNRSWGASVKTLENINRLRAGALAVVTGQQVGLFGGPAFSLYKALTAVKLAQQASAAGVDCVPVFWLATEDHDLAEINHISIPAADLSPQRLQAATQGLPDAPVGTIRFGSEIAPLVDAAAQLLGESDAVTTLRDCYRPGETLGSSFARCFARWFADWGVILLDASDPDLHAVAKPLYREALERAAELDRALLERGKALESAGYHQQVKVTPSSTLLFTKRNGARVPVHRRANGNGYPDDLVVGEAKVPQAELLRQVEAAPHHFSPNVLLRPVVQDYLLPTLAYAGGAAEVAYFAQAAVVYQALLRRVTPIIPRFSATLVETKPESLLSRYGLGLPDLFHGPDLLREQLADRVLPQDVQAAFASTDSSLETSLASVREALSRLDVTLVEAANRAESKIRYQIRRLRSRAARAEARHLELIGRHAAILSNALYPNKSLQEREIGGIYFLARYGTELLERLLEWVHTDCLDHQVISL